MITLLNFRNSIGLMTSLVEIDHELTKIEEMFRVADYDASRVEETMVAYKEEKVVDLFKAAVNSKGLSGLTRWPIIIFLVFYYIFQFLYQVHLF